MEEIKKKIRTGKFWSLGIAAAFLFFLSDANAQEYSKENTRDTQEETITDSTDYHNLDYREENNEDFGKKEKLLDDREKAYEENTPENNNTGDQSGSFEQSEETTGQADQEMDLSTKGAREDSYPEDEPYREKKHEGVNDGIYQNSDPYRVDDTRQNDQPETNQNDQKQAMQDTTDQGRQQYGLNQEIIEEQPTREELKQTEETYKKYQDAVYGIATYQVEYPDMMFDYEYNDKGELSGVTITGIENQEDKDKASEWLIQAHKLSDSLKYRKDENGVYYQTEQRARYKDGRQELYQELRGNLSYPEDAEDAGIEGVVQLHFIVDRFGNVQHIEAQEDIEGGDWIVDQMVEEAKNAFERIDQDWIPGEIHNIEVPQWVTIPVHFSIKLPPGLQML